MVNYKSKPFNLSADFALSFIEIRKKKQAEGFPCYALG